MNKIEYANSKMKELMEIIKVPREVELLIWSELMVEGSSGITVFFLDETNKTVILVPREVELLIWSELMVAYERGAIDATRKESKE